MKLKTLKDTEMLWRFSELNENDRWDTFLERNGWKPQKHEEMVSVRELRAEAIKWIKEFKEELKEHWDGEQPTSHYYDCLLEKIRWIEKFFNISEEDLK